jgi:hypothetical protein
MFAVAALITLIVIVRSFTGGNETPIAAASPVPTDQIAIVATPAPTVVVASPTPIALQPTAQPTVPVVGEGECSDADTSIRVEVDRETTAVGEGVHIKMIVKNISAVACKRDVGSGANEVTVISGPALIWSTDHCNPSTEKDLVELAPGQEWSVNVVWIGKQTAKGCKVRNMAEPGAYWAHGRNASLNSDGFKFVVQ